MVRWWAAFLFLPMLGCQSAPEGVLTGSVVAMSAFTLENPHGPSSTVVTVTLQDCPPGSRCEVVRYWNGQFQDYQSLRTQKRGTTTESLRWPGTLTKAHRAGTYRLKVFLNGRFARQIDYTG